MHELCAIITWAEGPNNQSGPPGRPGHGNRALLCLLLVATLTFESEKWTRVWCSDVHDACPFRQPQRLTCIANLLLPEQERLAHRGVHRIEHEDTDVTVEITQDGGAADRGRRLHGAGTRRMGGSGVWDGLDREGRMGGVGWGPREHDMDGNEGGSPSSGQRRSLLNDGTRDEVESDGIYHIKVCGSLLRLLRPCLACDACAAVR